MTLDQAQIIAQNLVSMMAPFCDRVEIAGSIRRQKDEVKDIEIVVIPHFETHTLVTGLFDEEEVISVNMLHFWATNEASISWIKPGLPNIVPWPISPDGKYWRGYLPEHDVKLDVFLCTPENWGTTFLIRTGAADFSRHIVTFGRNIGRPFVEGRLQISGVPVETREEKDVFDLLGLDYLEPQNRIDGRSAWRLIQNKKEVTN